MSMPIKLESSEKYKGVSVYMSRVHDGDRMSLIFFYDDQYDLLNEKSYSLYVDGHHYQISECIDNIKSVDDFIDMCIKNTDIITMGLWKGVYFLKLLDDSSFSFENENTSIEVYSQHNAILITDKTSNERYCSFYGKGYAYLGLDDDLAIAAILSSIRPDYKHISRHFTEFCLTDFRSK